MSQAWEEALFQAGELLLNGWGYNWYRAEDLMRADDVLLRNHADALLGEAEAALRQAEAAFRRAHLPPPSREQPLPDPRRMAELRASQQLIAEIEAQRTAIRGATMPPDDKIRRRHHDERALLARLGRCDAVLVGAVEALRVQALRDGPSLLGDPGTALRAQFARVAGALAQRRELLTAPPP